MKEVKRADCFVDSEIYKDKFEKLLEKGQIMLIMICNNLVLRINRIHLLYDSYNDLRVEYSFKYKPEQSMRCNDFILVEEIVYHARKAIDEMIYSLWMNKVGISNIDEPLNDCIDSIGKYLNQKVKILTEFDDYLEFFNDVNIFSNTYKHSICTFSVIDTDLSYKEDFPSFFSYAIREKDPDVKIIQKSLLENLDELFELFLSYVCK